MRKGVNIQKASIYSIIINSVQIAAILSIAVLVLLTDIERRSVFFVEFIVCLAAVLVIWGAVVDITQALSTKRINEQSMMLEEAYGQLEALNGTLRSQRHDFMSHLQVVSSLIEMGEHQEASEYIEQVYGDIQSVSAALRTGNPAINALLKVKLGESKARGVIMDVRIRSPWDKLSVQGWEMCRVLSNLIDNALDALKGTLEPRLVVSLDEDEARYSFAVENNGPSIPVEIRERIFHEGFTTKGNEHGMGLSIVRRILTENGGGIALTSGEENTVVFQGWIPR